MLATGFLVTILSHAETGWAATNAAGFGEDSLATAGDHGVGRHIGAADADRYRRIFALQDAGDLAAADRLIAGLQSDLLLGHVLHQRYLHPTAYRSSFEELSGWLERYADHPGAKQVYRLAVRRQPAGHDQPVRPTRGYLSGSGQELQERSRIPYETTIERGPEADQLVKAWHKSLERHAWRGEFTEAEAELTRADVLAVLDPVEIDLARITVAHAHLTAGRADAAFVLASRAAAESARVVPEVHWTAGLSAYRAGKLRFAAWHFSMLAHAEDALAAERARAAYWAARSYIALMQPQNVRAYLEIAAGGRDFYGLLARAALGRPVAGDAIADEAEDRAQEVILSHAGAQRALALAEIGELQRAEQEIRKLAARAKPEVMVGLIALAESLELPAAQMRLAQSLGHRTGGFHMVDLFPMPNWQPATGYTLDRALVFAIMRAESGFDPAAESHVGAKGLMQLMPATAKYIAGRTDLELPQTSILFQPETSIEFGQAYLEYLLRHRGIGDNVMFVAAAYNAGPGRISRWYEAFQIHDDPLLFLESMPLREPRVYVKKVMTNLWNYRARLGQPQPSLDALLQNRWPGYQSFDPRPQLHAWN